MAGVAEVDDVNKAPGQSEQEEECVQQHDAQKNLDCGSPAQLNLQTEVLLFIIKLKGLLYYYSPVNHTGSPQGFSQFQVSHKMNTIENMHITRYINIKIKRTNIIRKLVPSVLLS